MLSFRSVLVVTAVLGLLALSGCYIDVEDEGPVYYEPGVHLADLEVRWRILGSQAASLCDSYGIDSWRVELRGPEARDVIVDCRMHYWSSENDLLALTEGTYDIKVRALDLFGTPVTSQSTTVDLWDAGHVETMTFEFFPQDFGF